MYVYDDISLGISQQYQAFQVYRWKDPMDKNFYANCQHYATLDEAVKSASRAAAKSQTDVKVYQAVKLVSPKSPEVDVTDIK